MCRGAEGQRDRGAAEVDVLGGAEVQRFRGCADRGEVLRCRSAEVQVQRRWCRGAADMSPTCQRHATLSLDSVCRNQYACI